MNTRQFGHHDFKVSALGYGGGHIGSPQLSEADVETLLHTLLDWGITLFDTAPSYGESEARIGKAFRHKRDQVVLSTKVGYGIAGVQDWTYPCIIQGVDRALQRMQTDYLDIVHFHSCPLHVLEQGEVTRALHETVKAGKVRVAAYSGENEALAYAIQSGQFGSVQTSVNLTDQYSLSALLPQAKAQHMGVIAKRPMANAFWRSDTAPTGEYCETYWHRWQAMALQFELPMAELALRFVAFAPGVDSCIIGSTNLHHLHANLRTLEAGPLPRDVISAITHAFTQQGDHWQGEI